MANLLMNLKWLDFIDFIDILLITFVVYQLFILFHKTKGFRILIGLFCLAIIYILVRSWGLFLSTLAFQIFWQALIILIIIIFQPEIREVLARVNFFNFIQGKKVSSPDSLMINAICKATFQMAEEKTGAIIVLKQKEELKNLIMGGTPFNGEINELILLSIFQKNSPIHDGAILIDEGKIKVVGCYLPITDRENLPSRYGSRHRAAIGLSEKSDAIVIVISEAKGEVCVVQNGKIKKIGDIKALENFIKKPFLQIDKQKPLFIKTLFSKIFIKNWTKKAVSFLLVFIFWILLAGQQNYSQNLIIPIEYKNVPPNIELVAPAQNAKISIKGLRKLVSSLKPEDIRIELDVSLAQWGKRTYYISQKEISLPAGIQLVYIEPSVIRLDFDTKSSVKKNNIL